MLSITLINSIYARNCKGCEWNRATEGEMMYNKENPSYHLNYLMLRKMTDLGVAVNILNDVLRLDIFDDLSKHARLWQNEDDEIWEELNKIRSGLIDVEEKVSKAIEILDVEVPE